jgi:GH3 auxin-responsive promoter
MPGELSQRLRLLLVRALPRTLRGRLLTWPHRGAHRRLLSALEAPDRAQRASLRRIIEANRSTEFGRAHAFDQIQDPASLAANVPLRGFGELEPYILRQQGGESDVLVAGPLLGFAVSGGTRGSPKPIPVTPASLELWEWSEQLLERLALQRCPHVAGGRCLHLLPGYPAGRTSRGALPMLPMQVLQRVVGGNSPGARALPHVLPHELFALPDEAIRYYLVLRLAMTRRVTVLRAASPGTLTIMAEHLEALGPRLLDDLASGRVDHLEDLPEEVRQVVPRPRADPALAARLREQLDAAGRLEPRALWPSLGLLICSTTGASRAAADRLSDRFGDLPLLDPGYRSVEAVVTWPGIEGTGGFPAVEGQLLEFLPADGDGRATVLVGDLAVGRCYQPVVTGPNGLYRYVMDDLLEVLQHSPEGPRLALVGPAAQRLQLAQGALAEEPVGEAVVDAARSCELVLNGYTAWLQREAEHVQEHVQGQDAAAEGGLFARLGRRLRSMQSGERGEAAALTFAVDPAEAGLGLGRARRLVDALDSALRRYSATYEGAREDSGPSALGKPRLLVLRPGTFSRRRRRRLAAGAAGAHAPIPALSDDGWVVDPEDVELRV